MSKVIRARYENGVLKSLEPLDLEEGEEVTLITERDIKTVLKKYRGVLGEESVQELLELEERAWLNHSDLR